VPSRKQRRRREKLQRHEYEYVVETDEGEEVPVERPRPRAADGTKDGRSGDAVLRDRRGRPVPKPSLQRVLKRTMILLPAILLFIWLTSPKTTLASKAITTLTLACFFIPFSYMVDTLLYRSMQKRAQQRTPGRR
jgi:hypothetical protein